MSTNTKSRRRPETPTKKRPIRGRRLFADDDDTEPPKKPKQKSVVEVIREEFYNPKTGLWSADKVFRKLKARGVKTTLSQVEKVLANQQVSQVYKPQGKYKEKFTTIYAEKPRTQYQVDLLDLSKYSKFNKGFKWLMNGVDVHSRYAVSIPMKTKEIVSVLPAFKEIVSKLGAPENLNTDLEAAMMGPRFQSYLKEEDIRHWKNDPEKKRNNSIVERFNRTIREVIQKYFSIRKTKNWVNVLPDIIENYNTTFHTGIDAIPKEVWSGKSESKQEPKYPKFDIKIGDTVRILKRYSEFTKKSDVKKFTKNLYKVIAREGATFKVKNDKGVVQERKDYELQKVNPEELQDAPAAQDTGEGKEFKKEVKRRRAERRLRKEDIGTDLTEQATKPKDTKRKPQPRIVPTNPPAPKPKRKRKATAQPETFVIERLLEKKGGGKNTQYLVKWKGYPVSEASYERVSSLRKTLTKQQLDELIAEMPK